MQMSSRQYIHSPVKSNPCLHVLQVAARDAAGHEWEDVATVCVSEVEQGIQLGGPLGQTSIGGREML